MCMRSTPDGCHLPKQVEQHLLKNSRVKFNNLFLCVSILDFTENCKFFPPLCIWNKTLFFQFKHTFIILLALISGKSGKYVLQSGQEIELHAQFVQQFFFFSWALRCSVKSRALLSPIHISYITNKGEMHFFSPLLSAGGQSVSAGVTMPPNAELIRLAE